MAVNDDNTVSFVTLSDNVGVEEYGLTYSNIENYNSNRNINIENGTVYGYVKDAAGNSGSCSVTITSTTTSIEDNYLSCEDLEYYGDGETACKMFDETYTYSSNNCSSQELYDVSEYECAGDDGTVTCNDGTVLYYSPEDWYYNFEAVTPDFEAVCGIDGYDDMSSPDFYWSEFGSYQDTSCSATTNIPACDGHWDLGAMYTTCSPSGTYEYSGNLVCSQTIYDCASGYSYLNDSYCYKYN